MKNMIWSAIFLCFAGIGLIWGYVFLYHHAKVETVQEVAEPVMPVTPITRSATIIFAGDINFDRYIRQMAEHNGYDRIFTHIRDVMYEGDCVFANLEGPITENRSVSQGSTFGSAENYQFTFDPAVRDTLKNMNVCAVNLGNNHIHNFGEDGIYSTKNFLEEKGIMYVGDTGLEEEKRYDVITINDVKIGVVNYNAFVAESKEHVRADMIAIKELSDFVVVYTHWGVEYASVSRNMERTLAHELIDAGADVIIGSHPHVVQETEEYKGKMIYYSLGNFVFDQFFRAETQKGLLVAVTFDKEHDTLTFRDYAVCMKNTGQTVLCDSKK